MPAEPVDVLIAGGGPAGCAAALALRRHSELTVRVVERRAYGRDKAGETLSPGVLPLLDHLGVGADFRTAGFTPSQAFTAAWGSSVVAARDFLFTGRGHGWHLDRARFDGGLAAAARASGAVVSAGAVRGAVRSPDDGWTVRLPDGQTVRARYLIDASGRGAWLARAAGARVRRSDRLVGMAARLPAPAGGVEECSLVEAVPAGWWYTAPVPGGQVVAMLMTDADLLPAGAPARLAYWRDALGPHTRARLGGLPAGVTLWPACSQRLDTGCGPGWAAAGDALAAFDPLSSMGIGYALASGIEAARLAAAALSGGATAARVQAYAADAARHVARYEELKQGYYRAERRYADAPFWRRRG